MGPHHNCNIPRQTEITYQPHTKICKATPRILKRQFSARKPQRKPAKVLSICLIPHKSHWKENKNKNKTNKNKSSAPYLDVSAQKRLAAAKNKSSTHREGSRVRGADDCSSPGLRGSLGELRQTWFPPANQDVFMLLQITT